VQYPAGGPQRAPQHAFSERARIQCRGKSSVVANRRPPPPGSGRVWPLVLLRSFVISAATSACFVCARSLPRRAALIGSSPSRDRCVWAVASTSSEAQAATSAPASTPPHAQWHTVKPCTNQGAFRFGSGPCLHRRRITRGPQILPPHCRPEAQPRAPGRPGPPCAATSPHASQPDRYLRRNGGRCPGNSGVHSPALMPHRRQGRPVSMSGPALRPTAPASQRGASGERRRPT